MTGTQRSARRWPRAATRLVALAAAAAIVPAGSAPAHGVTATIAPPGMPVVEDSGFAIVFTGDVTSLGDGGGYIRAKIRPVGGPPCAPTESDDPGTRVDFGGAFADAIDGPFRSTGSYVADEPRDYAICAWVLDGLGETGPPTTATVTVRPPVLQITAMAPASASEGVPFSIAVSYHAEVPRYLSILVVRASSCSVSADALAGITADPAVVADDQQVSGLGSLKGNVRLDASGTYRVCGFLDENITGAATAQLVVEAATITVAAPLPAFRSCGSAGTRRHIFGVRARNVSCGRAKAIARRWGTPRRAPRRIGAFRCFARSGAVTCTTGTAQVRFRYSRRGT